LEHKPEDDESRNPSSTPGSTPRLHRENGSKWHRMPAMNEETTTLKDLEEKEAHRERSLRHRFHAALLARLSIHGDQAPDAWIDENLRNSAEIKGATLWILMFAIFVASIGLNVNSTAVIIGAMLISPLMGPIMGIGYGIGIYDLPLVRRSLKNLGITTLISLLTSTAYFLVTPLSGAQSELLARTTPTLWDVLIALFGGLAGIIGATRKEKTNVIPGVAIATALMPPLCTTGYALAKGNLEMMLGAFYLFSINAVFIAFATVIVIWLLNPPHKQFVDGKTEIRVKRYLMVIVLITVLPSIYLAIRLVQDELYNASARAFIRQQINSPTTHVIEQSISPRDKRIEVTLVGELLNKTQLAKIQAKLPDNNLTGSTLVVHQGEENQIDVTTLKASIASDLFINSQKALADSQKALDEKDKAIEHLQDQLQAERARGSEWPDVGAELHAQYPNVLDALISEATEWKAGTGASKQKVIVLAIKTKKPLKKADKQRIENWLKVRTKSDKVQIIYY
jgi:uncharacterized hydrophobic protein (TIGR00271 family)